MNKKDYFRCRSCNHYQREYEKCEICGCNDLIKVIEDEYNANYIVETLEKQLLKVRG